MELSQELALLADELARHQVTISAVGVDHEYVYDEIIEIDTAALAALEVEIEVVGAAVEAVADELGELSDSWFVELDGLDGSQDPAHVAYAETSSRRSSMRFVLAASCLLLALAACVGASV